MTTGLFAWYGMLIGAGLILLALAWALWMGDE
jgi:hypothetical protein